MQKIRRKGERKVKKIFTGKIGKINAMKICSFQITFKRKSIIENNIKFDDKFGANTCYNRGEETIFLYECINKGLKIKFVNKKIANVDQKNSTWFDGYTPSFFKQQGAVFYRLSAKKYKLLIYQFAIRKYKLYKGKMKLKEVIKCMMEGAKEYISSWQN